jgi:hypothetical protein
LTMVPSIGGCRVDLEPYLGSTPEHPRYDGAEQLAGERWPLSRAVGIRRPVLRSSKVKHSQKLARSSGVIGIFARWGAAQVYARIGRRPGP